jgi:hypothetical protein
LHDVHALHTALEEPRRRRAERGMAPLLRWRTPLLFGCRNAAARGGVSCCGDTIVVVERLRL